MKDEFRTMNQIIVINKPAGMTSQTVDTKLKHILNVKHIGHLGTLDPIATGVLVVMVDGATKLAPFLENDDKAYLATICFGLKTDTLDITGQVTDEQKNPKVSFDELDKVLTRFQGEITQTPPIYSALKVNGKKLYEYARKGDTVEIKPRNVTIYELTRTSDITADGEYAYAEIKVHCSKGTYIRSLIDDIGKALGIPCCMQKLTRIKSGNFTLANAVEIEDVMCGNYQYYKMQEALQMPLVEITDLDVLNKVRNGMKLSPTTFKEHFKEVALTYQDELIAIYQFVGTDIPGYHPVRVWHS